MLSYRLLGTNADIEGCWAGLTTGVYLSARPSHFVCTGHVFAE